MLSPEISRPILWLRGEGLAVLLLSFALYSQHETGWLTFVVLFFVPDLAMLGYLSGPRTGALLYNLAHTYTAPVLLASAGLIAQNALLIPLALIWSAHIGLDRMLGYGLKMDTAFQDTHLGRIGGRAGNSALDG
ncbi:DUF4260 domain-containing protein [soil metagenome]